MDPVDKVSTVFSPWSQNDVINLYLFYRAAVSKCPTDQSDSDEYLTLEQKQNMIDAKHANIRDLICKFDIHLNHP